MGPWGSACPLLGTAAPQGWCMGPEAMHSAHSARFPGEGTSTGKGSRGAALLGWMFGKSPPAWGFAGKLGWVLLGCLGIFKELLNGPKLGLAELPGPLLPPRYPGRRSLLGTEAMGCLWVPGGAAPWRLITAPCAPSAAAAGWEPSPGRAG